MFMDNKCPYCGGQCEIGNLLASHCDTIYWTPNGLKPPLFLNPIKDYKLAKKGSVIISSGFSAIKMKATICKNCKTIFLNYGEDHPSLKIRE